MVLTLSMAAMAAWWGVAECPERVDIRLNEGPHPRAFLTAPELDGVRRRARDQAWAKALRDGLVKAAGGLVAEALEAPHAEGQWTHWYNCANDSGRLRAASPTEHVCTVCGKVYSGWPYDDVYVTQRHHHWLNGIETLGLAYALEGDAAYAERVRAILLEYASFYGDLELHDVHNEKGQGGRLYAQTLDESVTLCRISLGYDLVYDAPCFSAADHKTIRDGLLMPMVETIQANPRNISNWQSWHNAGVGSVGFVLGDEALADWALNGRCGFLYQMQHSLMASGMWYEESPAYHWYALSAHVYLMEAAARAGIDLYAIPIVKAMFDAPVRQLLPDLTFVPFHDSDRGSIRSQRRFYEVAYARFKDPNYLRFIVKRDAVWALLWGADALPAAPEGLAPASSNAPGEGLAILRDAANETVAFLDYAPGKSGHVQPAKLNLVIYAHGDIRLADPGRLPYGNPMHRGWFRQTVAHNTVVVNQTSQLRAPGALEAFAVTDGFALCRATCTKAYKNRVTLDRTVLLRDNVIVDVFTCAAREPSTFDLPLHFAGTLEGLPEAAPADALGDGEGYQHLANVRRCAAPVRSFVVDTGGGNTIHVSFHDNSEVFLAEGYGPGMKTMLPLVLRRQEGVQARFVTAYQILGPDESPEKVRAKGREKTTVRFDDVKLALSDETVVSVGKKRHRVGPDGIQ